MALINYTFKPAPNYGSYYKVDIYSMPDMDLVHTKNIYPPFPIQINESAVVPEFEDHVVRITSMGCGTIAAEFSVTKAISGCLPITGLTIENATSNAVFFNWLAPASIPLNGYEWIITEVGGSVVATNVTSLENANYTQLQPNKTYRLDVRSLCAIASSGFTSLTFNTITAEVVDFYNYTQDAVLVAITKGTPNGPNLLPVTTYPGASAGIINLGSTYSNVYAKFQSPVTSIINVVMKDTEGNVYRTRNVTPDGLTALIITNDQPILEGSVELWYLEDFGSIRFTPSQAAAIHIEGPNGYLEDAMVDVNETREFEMVPLGTYSIQISFNNCLGTPKHFVNGTENSTGSFNAVISSNGGAIEIFSYCLEMP